MEKLIITQELKDANIGKLDDYEVGQEVEFTQNRSTRCEREATVACSGHWVEIGGVCVCDPAP